MITLPDYALVQTASPIYINYGGVQESSLGGETQQYNTPGNRFGLSVQLVPLSVDEARVVVARLIRAKQDKLRIAWPLQQSQGSPGAALAVNGAVTAATTSLPVDGGTPGYLAKEGYWLSIEAASGQHYMHQLASNVSLNGSGAGTLSVHPAMRFPFADGARVHLARPMIEGYVVGDDMQWQLSADRFIPLEFEIRESR